MHGTYYEAHCLDRDALGKDAKEFTEYVCQQTPKDIMENVNSANTANVLFDQLVRNPVETVRGMLN